METGESISENLRNDFRSRDILFSERLERYTITVRKDFALTFDGSKKLNKQDLLSILKFQSEYLAVSSMFSQAVKVRCEELGEGFDSVKISEARKYSGGIEESRLSPILTALKFAPKDARCGVLLNENGRAIKLLISRGF